MDDRRTEAEVLRCYQAEVASLRARIAGLTAERDEWEAQWRDSAALNRRLIDEKWAAERRLRVRLTEAAKRRMRGTGDPIKDSAEHVTEFGDAIGVIEGLLDGVGPEIKVRWIGSGLAYGYPASDLEGVPDGA